jgi:hypothetical protein
MGHASSSPSHRPGDGSGRRRVYPRVTEKDGVRISWSGDSGSSHAAGAFQGLALKLRTGDGGIAVLSGSSRGAGTGGKGFSLLRPGCGGAVRMNDLKDRTGRSIPLRDDCHTI